MKLRKLFSSTSLPYAVIIPLFTALSFYGTYQILEYMLQPKLLPNIIAVQPEDNVSTNTPKTKQPPTAVYISRINKRLPIQAAVVQDNNWQLFDKSVAWLSTSSVPQEGNVILYAHNWKSLWGDLYKVQPGDKIEVEQNGNVHIYEVTESHSVSKNDVDAILSDENKLTMYTCEGTFDQKRRVVYAKPL